MPSTSDLQTFALETLTVDNTSGGVRLTLSNILTTPQAKACTITQETAQMRWTKDGTAPTTSVGHLSNVGTVIFIDNPSDMVRFRAIRTGSTSATLMVSYHRW